MAYTTNFHQTDISRRRILVTGGAGFIGSNIAEYLLRFGAKVRVLDNLATGKPENVAFLSDLGGERFEMLEGDIRDGDVCAEAVAGVDMVCHQAALGSVPRSIAFPEQTNAVNVSGFLNMLEATRKEGIRRFVFASSSSVYGDEPTLPKVEDRVGEPLSPYAVSKKANEYYARVYFRLHALEVVGLRYFNVFGPRQDPHGAYAAVIPKFIDKIQRGESVRIDGDGEQTRDFTYVENAVQANIRALFTQNNNAFGEVFNVAVGENFTVLHLFNTIASRLQSNARPEFVEPREGDIRNSLADISKASALLGYQPSMHFENGLEATVDYFRNISHPSTAG